ncbi:MMPL family transporter [Nevskia sp.]|uniref:MMPL family transporter n=1 Tax=Nevskia sp. TaxID=1929292 RepID=UPI0025D09531|nr:MMPL family transporter [Nevskia sp.]
MILRFRLFVAVLALLACGLALQLQRGLHFETDILALLPADGRDPALDTAKTVFEQHIARRLTLLIGAADPEAARKAATVIAGQLRASQAFANVQFEIGKDWAASAGALLPYRLGLLSDAHRSDLQQGRTDALRDEALQALYAPAAFGRVVPAAQDLTGLLSGFVLAQSQLAGRATLDRSLLVVHDDAITWVLIALETAGSPFAAEAQDQVTAALDSVLAKAPDVQVLRSGVVLHAADAARRAKSEMSLFGSLSSAAVVLLIWLTFRSLQPLVLSLLSLGVGAAAGLLACQWAFGSVHLITMVFGTSLIGVAVDYSLHFFSDQFRDRDRWTGLMGYREVGMAILIGHLASALGYATLLIPPFPGLRQMALFSIVGLMFSCASVLCLYPRLARASVSKQHQPLVLKIAQRLSASRFQFRASLWHIGGALLLIGLTATGLARLTFRDDIRLMQSSPPELISEEKALRALLGIAPDSRYLLLTAESAEALLQREEALTAVLSGLQQRDALDGWLAVSRLLPSMQRQTDNQALQRAQVYSANGLLPALMRQLGASDAAIAEARAAADAEAPLLTPERWLADPASAALRPLWLGEIGGHWASAVTLNGLRDAKALDQAIDRLPGVHLIDRIGEVSALMSRYRQGAVGLMAAVSFAIFVLLALRYGWLGGLLCLLPPVGGSLIAMALLGWAGISANLFNVLALLLLIGMGVDYAVFLREGRRTQVTVLLAVGLSALTTLLSFGLLTLSSTPFIRAIGLTLAPGIALIFLLAIWLGPAPEREEAPC